MISLNTAPSTRSTITSCLEQPSDELHYMPGRYFKASAHIFDKGLQKTKLLFCSSCLTFLSKRFGDWICCRLQTCGTQRKLSVQSGPSDTVCITGQRKTFYVEYSHQDAKGSSCRYVLLTELNTKHKGQSRITVRPSKENLNSGRNMWKRECRSC